MRRLQFYGSADSVFAANGTRPGEPSRFEAANGQRSVLVSNKTNGVYVVGDFDVADGIWTIGVRSHPDMEFPDWEMTVEEADYSACLTMLAPDDVVVSEPDPEVED